MLQLEIAGAEYWDEAKEEFVSSPGCTLRLEHSLRSLKKWESKWKKPYLVQKEMTAEEMLDYIRCMTLGPEPDPLVYQSLTPAQLLEIRTYINDPMTATTFREEENAPKNRSITTAEILYYEMSELNIPYSCDTWHLNQLMTLIRVCTIKRAPKKGKGKNKKAPSNWRDLNRRRREQSGSRG